MSDEASGPTRLLVRLTPVAATAHASLRARASRVRRSWRAIVQSGVAAGLAWYLARLIVGTPDPFFAPAAAVITVGLARGQSLRRAVELAIGVAIGIAIGFLLRTAIGLGPIQIGGIVALTIVAALLVDSAIILSNQAAISAVLVMTLPSAALGSGPDRFFDALIGGAVALLISKLVFVRSPASLVAAPVRRTLEQLAECLREAAAALEHAGLEQAQEALGRLRGLDAGIAALFEGLAAAQETATLSPVHRRSLGSLEPYGEAARQIDYAVRNARVLLRACAAALRTGVDLPPLLSDSIVTLADAVDALSAQLLAAADPARTRERAVAATAQATDVLQTHNDLRTTMIIGQVRATAVDLLRASGLDAATARAALPPAQPEDL